MIEYISVIHPSSWPNNILSYGYTLHFIYLFICWWIFELFPPFGYCEEYCCEHSCTRFVFSKNHLFSILFLYTLEKNCRQVIFKISFEKLEVFITRFAVLTIFKCTVLCYHHCYPSPELFHHPKLKLCAHYSCFLWLLPILNTSCNWNHTIFVVWDQR